MCTGRALRSISTPSRAYSCNRFPSTLSADTMGGTCKMSPVRFSRTTRCTSAGVTALMLNVSNTSPESSSVLVREPSTTSATYSLSAPDTNCMSRVARPTATTNTPVASGSRVPACPMRRSLNDLRNVFTTSWLVTPAGLSMSTRPCTCGGRRFAISVIRCRAPRRCLVPLPHDAHGRCVTLHRYALRHE